MSNYFYGTVPLSNILQSGSDVVTGFYNVSGNTVSTISFDITNSTASKPNPIPFPYQYLNTSLGNFAAKHVQYTNTTQTNIAKPAGANAMRFIITGGSGGGGGGSGGCWQGAGEDHITQGFEGRVGADGGITYSTSDISITNINSVTYWIGNGGNGGSGGSGSPTSSGNLTVVNSTAGSAGNSGNNTTITIGAATYTGNLGVGGAAGPGQRAESDRGWSSSMVGANTATANFRGNTAAVAGYGNSLYGDTDTYTPGSYNAVPPVAPVITHTRTNATIANTSPLVNANFDNNIVSVTRTGGAFGAGGGGYRNVNSGSTNGASSGSGGSAGQVTIIWLY